MPTAHVVSTKLFTFRGQPERWSNGYNFQLGGNALTPEFAEELYLAVRAQERQFHSTDVRFVYGVVGLLNEDAVWSNEYGNAGPVGISPQSNMHPETVVMTESKLRNRVYLRKFYHTRAHVPDAPTESDLLRTPDKTGINAAVLKFTDGSMPGGVLACFPNGDVATTPFVCDPYMRTRQLKRRGRRPTP